MIPRLLHTACACLLFICCAAQQPAYLNTKINTEARVTDLVSRLNLSQKIKLLRYTGTPIDSNGLHIPAYNWWNECLHGVARAGKATVFPQTIGLAATWDTALVHRTASAIADEARAKYEQFSANGKRGIYQGLNFWTPNINIFRDPRWGRGMETYGEDPLLTGSLASAFIRGIQGNHPKYFKAIATVKHFVVHSGPEASRHSFDARVSDRDLYETYTPAFEKCIKEAKVYSLMCAYNRFRGEPCCGSSFLLNDLLRKQWHFNGFIVTDCWALADFYNKGMHEVVGTPEEAAAIAVKAGVDLECGAAFNALDKAVAKGLVTEPELDIALKRLFTARFKLGAFDPPASVPFSNTPYTVVESPKHRALALEAARRSIVLLKNKGELLPLKNIKTLAVIGPNADDADVMLANYHGYPTHVVTPLEGLKNRLPGTKILYAKGSVHAAELPDMQVIPASCLYLDAAATKHGLEASYYKNINFEGVPAIWRTDSILDFYWISKLPAAGFDREHFSVRWSGYIKAPATGRYYIGVKAYDQCRLFFNDSLVARIENEHEPGHASRYAALEAGKTYKILLEYISTKAAPLVQLKWQQPGEDLLSPALAIAKQADAVVMCMGLSPQLEGEEMNVQVDGFYKGDRTKLHLPAVQSALIRQIHALGKPVILVLVNGSALSINWENENIPAIIEAWYGGQEAGNAIADVLTGKYNPAGRLPVTFYTSEAQLPAFENYDMQGRTYRYLQQTPLYKFGFGLSYTRFEYSKLLVSGDKTGQPIRVSVTIKNTGAYDGDEVVQLYIRNPAAAKNNEIHALKAFARVHIKKGATQTVKFILNPAAFSVIAKGGKKWQQPGLYIVSVGGMQPAYDQKPGSAFVQAAVTLQGGPLLLPL